MSGRANEEPTFVDPSVTVVTSRRVLTALRQTDRSLISTTGAARSRRRKARVQPERLRVEEPGVRRELGADRRLPEADETLTVASGNEVDECAG
jgi:hypothetical protein